MQAPDNGWEKTRRRIFWDFLENPRFELSPIPEEDPASPDTDTDSSLPDLIVEPEPDRHDHPPSFYVGLSPIPEADRASPDTDTDTDSSLPDLIVEPEPDRHDDPPSFYVDLERRMKRYYRQLFHPGKS
ncbi:uncharacterized protein LOC134752521 [Cydia strobilella]|uniref:uncharacterized protein LOC134752521 n=1 Tax=Cydia strobilella TaxID=1100964 RepID=UPI003007642A